MARTDDYRKQKAQMESDADDLESGRWRIGSIFSGRYVDESDDLAADKRNRAGLLGKIIAAFER